MRRVIPTFALFLASIFTVHSAQGQLTDTDRDRYGRGGAKQGSHQPLGANGYWLRMGDSPLAIQLLGTVDASAFRMHYDIVRNGNMEELASSWVVQPGVALAALLR